jgi:protease I
MAELEGIRVAILVTDGFEETELTSPMKVLRKEAAQFDIISPHEGKVQAFCHFDKGITFNVDRALKEVSADSYDAVLLPGGALNADQLRALPQAQAFVQAFDAVGKPIAAICHAPWLLVSAGLVRGRILTSYHTIRDDIVNAGGRWVDDEVVEHANWVTSRKPQDLPAFNRAMVTLFARIARRAKAA